jgi:hypothetical protein
LRLRHLILDLKRTPLQFSEILYRWRLFIFRTRGGVFNVWTAFTIHPLTYFRTPSLSSIVAIFLSFFLSLKLLLLLSLSEMAPKKATSNIPPTSQVRTKRSDGHVDLSPLEIKVETVLFERHEGVLRLNYNIPPMVRMFYQTPGARLIDGGNITLFERMFLAGLRLPFPEIARDFVLFLMVAPSQIMPNTWRYLFASYIL